MIAYLCLRREYCAGHSCAVGQVWFGCSTQRELKAQIKDPLQKTPEPLEGDSGVFSWASNNVVIRSIENGGLNTSVQLAPGSTVIAGNRCSLAKALNSHSFAGNTLALQVAAHRKSPAL